MSNRIGVLNRVLDLLNAAGATYEDAAYIGAYVAGYAVAKEAGDDCRLFPQALEVTKRQMYRIAEREFSSL